METRGNFILIGLFTILGAVGIVGLFLWFARVELDQAFDYYDIRFESVSGLSEASDVRFAGLPVGQVVSVRLSPDRSGTVTVRIEVDAETPVRTDSIATIEAQGVTGVSFVALSAGTPAADLIVATPENPFPNIESGPSVFQSLSQDAPRLITEVIAAVEEVNALLGEDNRERFQNILINAETASETLVETLDDFSAAAASAAEFGAQVALFNSILDSVADDLETLLITADNTLTSFGALSDEAETALEVGTETLRTAQSTIGAVETYITADLSAATRDVRDTLTTLQTEIAALSGEAQGMLSVVSETGTAATARLQQAEATIAAADIAIADFIDAMASVDATSDYFDALLRDEAEPFLQEARVAIAEATTVISAVADTAEEDLPVLVADIRAATASARATIETFGADVAAIGDQISGLTTTAETRLNSLTTAAETALSDVTASVEGNLSSVTATAEGAIEGVTASVDGTLTRLTGSAETALADLTASLDRNLSSVTATAEGAIEGVTARVDGSLTLLTETADTALADLTASVDGNLSSVTATAEGAIAGVTASVDGSLDRLTTSAETALSEVTATVDTTLTGAATTIQGDVSRVSAAVEANLATLTASADVTLRQVTETFAEANATLTAINEALAVGERTLDAATRTFEGADRLLNEDIDGIVAGLEQSLTSLNAAIGEVSGDLPEITEGLRDASQSAADAFDEVQRLVSASGASISRFAAEGLPAYTALAGETRLLIRNLDRLTTQIARDPARFFLDQQAPEFRR